MRPWQRALLRESVARFAVRGGGLALLLGSAVLGIGWITPWPEAELRPWAFQLALLLWLAALIVGAWPAATLHRAAVLDVRLGLGDRLASAWAMRDVNRPIVRLQRADAMALLGRRSPGRDVVWRPSRLEVGGVAALGVLTALLLISPSPQQAVLDQQAAEQLGVQRATDRLDVLRQEATSAATSLTPEQARKLDDLLQRTQAELNRVKTQRAAAAILARAEDQLTQEVADPNAELRDEALAAISETLAAEPLSRRLSEALQHQDGQAASQALEQLAAQADQLSEIERQALSRALQRAANVGRGDPSSASALREAARALAGREPSSAALAASEAALRESIQAANAQASLKTTTQRLRDLQAQLASGTVAADDDLSRLTGAEQPGSPLGRAMPDAPPIALDGQGGGRQRDPSAAPGSGAGVSGAEIGAQREALTSSAAVAENVFVPGREGTGPADQDLVEQPFSVRGVPRPYREVLGEYAQTSRDYVDRADVSPAVRELVKQYFLTLEEGQ